MALLPAFLAILSALLAAAAGAWSTARSTVHRIAVLPLWLALQIFLVAQALSALGVFQSDWLCGAHILVGLLILAVRIRFRSTRIRPVATRHRRPPWRRDFFTTRVASNCFAPAAWIVTAVVLCLTLFVAVRADSPLNYDAHTYRLPRIAFWLEAGAVSHIHTNNARMNLMPYGDALLTGWLYALTGTDRWIHLASWFFAAGLLAATHALSRSAGLCRRTAPLALVVLCGFPAFVTQASGVQSDIFAAYFAMIAILGAIRWLRTRQRRWLAIGSIALGLGIATKQTILLALPALGLIVAAYAFPERRSTLRRVLMLAACGMLGAILLGGWSYLNNYRWFGHPLGPQETRISESAGDRTFHGFGWRLKRELFIQFSPIGAPPWAAPALSGIRDALFASSATGWWISRAFRYEWEELLNHGGVLNHDVISFGTIPALLYVVALVFSWPRRHTTAQWLGTTLLWSGLVFLATIAATIDFMTTNGRFLLITAPFTAVGVVAVARRLRLARVRTCANALLLITGACGAICALCYHIQQPLFAQPSSPLLGYGDELAAAPGDTLGFLPGADGPIWSFLSRRADRRFVSLADADYPVGEEALHALRIRHGITTLVADVALQHVGAIPGRLAGLHTWFSHVPGKGMQRIFVSRRLPATALVKTGPGVRASGELRFELHSPSVRPCRWSCDPVRQPAWLEFDPAGGSCTFELVSETSVKAVFEIVLSDASRYVVRTGVNHVYSEGRVTGSQGPLRMVLHLVRGQNIVRILLHPIEWPDTTPILAEQGPSLVQIRIWPMASAQ